MVKNPRFKDKISEGICHLLPFAIGTNQDDVKINVGEAKFIRRRSLSEPINDDNLAKACSFLLALLHKFENKFFNYCHP